MFRKGQANGRRPVQTLRVVGISYTLIMAALVGFVGWRQLDVTDKLSRNEVAASVSKLEDRKSVV